MQLRCGDGRGQSGGSGVGAALGQESPSGGYAPRARKKLLPLKDRGTADGRSEKGSLRLPDGATALAPVDGRDHLVGVGVKIH